MRQKHALDIDKFCKHKTKEEWKNEFGEFADIMIAINNWKTKSIQFNNLFKQSKITETEVNNARNEILNAIKNYANK